MGSGLGDSSAVFLRLTQLNHIKFGNVVQSVILRLISNHNSIVALKGGLK